MKLGFGSLCLGAGTAVALAMPGSANAQNAGTPTAAPSRDELRGITETTPSSSPRLKVSGGIERSPCALADPRYADVRITISTVSFDGLKGATPEELKPAWAPFANTEQPVAALCEIRDAAATILRNKGYLAATEVPTQRIEDGEVRLQVLYGRLTSVRAIGETRGAESKLVDYLGQLTEDEIFNRNRAERYLLLARDLPGYDVQLTLKPVPGEAGALAGEVTVLRQPYRVDFTAQNYGADATGPFGGQLRAQFFGLTGMGDATTLSYFATSDLSEQHVVQAAHEFRPGREGLTISGQATYAWTSPDLGLNAAAVPSVGLDARTFFATVSARYPIKRTQGESIYLGGGLDFANQDVDFIAPLSRDRVRVAWARFQHDAIDVERRAPRYRSNISLELRQGLNILNASRACIGVDCPQLSVNPGRIDGQPDATVVRANGSASIALSRTFALSVKPSAQYAFSPLLGFEEFSVGNYNSGRGYAPGTIAGDSGIGLSAELTTGPQRLSEDLAITAQPYAFMDVAKVWNRNPNSSDKLYSVGAGIRASLGSRFRLDTTIAVPLKRAGLQTQRGDVRLLFTLTTRLLPWKN